MITEKYQALEAALTETQTTRDELSKAQAEKTELLKTVDVKISQASQKHDAAVAKVTTLRKEIDDIINQFAPPQSGKVST
jgi:septal ring factor EnvC (AmiA/AmiB activator)